MGVALALSVPLASLAATVTFDDNFENYDLGSYTEPLYKWRAGEVNTPYALKVVTGVSGRDGKQARFEYRNTDVNAPYNTVKADLAGDQVGMGTEQWMGFDVNLKDITSVNSDRPPLFFQYHMGTSGFAPPVSLTVGKVGTEQRLQLKVNAFSGPGYNTRTPYPFDIKDRPDGWVRIIVFTRFNSGSTGQVKLYVGGSLERTYNGPLGVPDAKPYPRIGIYKANDDRDLSYYAPKNIVYFDNVKMGATLSSVQ